jgi:hypothetical protein
MERLATAGPVLVHFFDFAQLNSLRALPYVLAWVERYRDHGLTAIGVHAPRFPCTRAADAVARAAGSLGIAHPVAVDSDFRLWREYGCRGWPSLFLWGRGGALRWYHFGEGEYVDTELALREELAGAGPAPEWPPPLKPIRPSDEPGAGVVVPTPELFPGGSADRPWRPDGGRPALTLEYEAGGAYASLDGRGTVRAALDGAAPRRIEVSSPGLVELAEHGHHERHALRLEPSAGIAVYSVSFAPGIPDPGCTPGGR